MVQAKEIVQFLEKMKLLISQGNYSFVKRDKNIQFLAENGWTIVDIKSFLLQLTIKDFYEGPVSDLDYSLGEIWIFKSRFEGQLLYIKLKLKRKENGEIILILSFHENENGGFR